MSLKNKLKKEIRILASKSLLFKKIFGLLNLINLPRKMYYTFCMNFGLIPKLTEAGNKLKNVPTQPVIISLTSYGRRVNETLHFTLFSLLSQSVKPDKIVVWLGVNEWHNGNLPKTLKKLTDFGVEIKFCKDIGPFTKIIPSLREFPDSVIVTADDDLYYPKNWLKKLLDCRAENPEKICIHRAHEITFTDGKINPYVQWKHAVKQTQNPENLFITGVGGVLYPPDSLGKNATNEELFLKLSPKADDVWLWAMAKLQKTPMIIVKNGYSKLNYIDIIDELSGLTIENVVNNRNDEQIKAVVEYFGLQF